MGRIEKEWEGMRRKECQGKNAKERKGLWYGQKLPDTV